MSKKEEQNIDTTLSALANVNRRRIVHTLAFSPATASELASECDITLPGMHKHLKILQEADLIRQQKVGRINFIALNPDSLETAQKWIQKYQTYWGSRRETLENFISRYNT